MLFRKQENLTQDRIAKELGVSTSYYSKIESCNKTPSYEFIRKFISRFPNVDTISTRMEEDDRVKNYINFALPARDINKDTVYSNYLYSIFEIEKPERFSMSTSSYL